MRLKLASRRSALAQIQTQIVAEKLRAIGHEVETVFRESSGDLNLQWTLQKVQSKGVFTEDFYQGLIGREFDVVVHSWKDLPTEVRPESLVAASLPREDVRDLLIVPRTKWPLVVQRRKLGVLSSSPRREYNLRPFFLNGGLPVSLAEVSFLPVRGNIQSRFAKVFAPDTDAQGLIVAKAAVDRILSCDLSDFTEVRLKMRQWLAAAKWMVLPLAVNPPAAAQGALALETLSSRSEVIEVLRNINHPPTFRQVSDERQILSNYGGGCHQKIGVGVLERDYGRLQFLRGVTDIGMTVNERTLIPKQDRPDWGVISAEQIFISQRDAKAERQVLPLQESQMHQYTGIWLAKAEAWRPEWKPLEEQTVWCSGVATWQKLSAMGIWVNGCADSLGENEFERIEHLVTAPLRWAKITHQEGYETPGKECLASYHVHFEISPAELSGKTHFFWSSASAFFAALKASPEQIKNGYHGCGLGHTAEILRRHLSHPQRLQMFLDAQDWLRYLGATSLISQVSV